MGTFSALLALCAGNSPVTGEFSSQRPVTRSFDVFLDLHLNKLLSKQSRRWWFETPSRSLWRHCNGLETMITLYMLNRPDEMWMHFMLLLNNEMAQVVELFPYGRVPLFSEVVSNELSGVSYHQQLDCLFKVTTNKRSTFRITALCEGNASMISAFPPYIMLVMRKALPITLRRHMELSRPFHHSSDFATEI